MHIYQEKASQVVSVLRPTGRELAIYPLFVLPLPKCETNCFYSSQRLEHKTIPKLNNTTQQDCSYYSKLWNSLYFSLWSAKLDRILKATTMLDYKRLNGNLSNSSKDIISSIRFWFSQILTPCGWNLHFKYSDMLASIAWKLVPKSRSPFRNPKDTVNLL